MKDIFKIAGMVAALQLFGNMVVAATEATAQPNAGKSAAVTTPIESETESAFASDLSAVQDLLKGISRERKMTPGQSKEYIAKEMEKARKFSEFAKTTLIPHSLEITKKMKEPDTLLAEGKAMVEKDGSSWQGYDYMASGSVLKNDLDGAMANFKKAAKYAPDLQKDWYNYMLGACYAGKKDDKKALGYYERVISRNDNWMAVKGAYLAASMTLVGKDPEKSVAYFDKGYSLHTQSEQAVLLKAGVCSKFQGLAKGPEACGNQPLKDSSKVN